MQYDWECLSCKYVTTVSRKLAEIDVPPEDGCEKCKHKETKRIITPIKKSQIGLVWGGVAAWHDEGYSKTSRIRDT